MSGSPAASLAICSLFWALSFGAQSCFFPYNQPQYPHGDSWLPCSDNGVSACCDFTYGRCSDLGNGLCYNTAQNFTYTGGCTDPTWLSPSCPNYCVDVTNKTWDTVHLCPENTFYCGSGGSCTSRTFALDHTATATSTSTTSSPSFISTSVPNNPSSTGVPVPLSTEKKSGVRVLRVVIGVTIGVVISALLVFCLWKWGRRRLVNYLA